MKEELYEAIFKRKSFHLFRSVGNEKITKDELCDIEKAYAEFDSLYPEIRTAVRIVSSSEVNFKNDAEYCVLIYSEEKDNYLLNAGYIGEQLDLYLVQHDIGSLWYGFGKPDMPEYDGMKFVIMFAIHKVSDKSQYRKDMFKAKRKPLSEVWEGEEYGIADISRFAPSACNTQPWRVKSEGGKLTVSRHKKSGIIGIVSPNAIVYFNRIDIGIYLCFLELCMYKEGIEFELELFVDNGEGGEFTKVAEYTVKEKQ